MIFKEKKMDFLVELFERLNEVEKVHNFFTGGDETDQIIRKKLFVFFALDKSDVPWITEKILE